jgi:hypothetical protein
MFPGHDHSYLDQNKLSLIPFGAGVMFCVAKAKYMHKIVRKGTHGFLPAVSFKEYRIL